MRVRQLTANLWQVNRFRFVNSYLVREPDGFTLVDTGLPRGADRLLAVARASGGAIRRIVLTHGHTDHAGSLDVLCERLGTEVEVAVGEPDALYWSDARPKDKLRGSWPQVRTKPTLILGGGERIGSLEVIATPGHTPGHMAFLDTRDRTLIAGDTFTTAWRTEIPNRLRQPFPLAAMGTQDPHVLVESARALATLEPALLVVGHGPAVQTPVHAIAAAIRRAAS